MTKEEIALKLTEIEYKNNVDKSVDIYLDILNKIDEDRVKFKTLVPTIRHFIKRIEYFKQDLDNLKANFDYKSLKYKENISMYNSYKQSYDSINDIIRSCEYMEIEKILKEIDEIKVEGSEE